MKVYSEGSPAQSFSGSGCLLDFEFNATCLMKSEVGLHGVGGRHGELKSFQNLPKVKWLLLLNVAELLGTGKMRPSGLEPAE